MCLSHLIYTVRPCLIQTCHAAPMPSPTMPFFSRPRHSTAVERRPVGYLLAFGFFRLPLGAPRSCYQMHTNLRCRWPVWNQTPFAWTRKRVVAAHYKKDSVGPAVRIFPATIRTFTKDTALWEQGRGAPWHVWINARHGRGTAWERHVICESALIVTLNKGMFEHCKLLLRPLLFLRILATATVLISI